MATALYAFLTIRFEDTSILDFIKYACAFFITKQQLYEWKLQKRTSPVEQIFLFGSYANGTPHADSDLDIYVVMPENANIREIDAMRLIYRAIRDFILALAPEMVPEEQGQDESQSQDSPSL